jgi:hypothetical protein
MNAGTWFHCLGCGALAGYFPDGYTDPQTGSVIPTGAVCHTKPTRDINRVSVRCPLYQKLEPDEYWTAHKDAPRVDPPDSLSPVTT